MFFGKSKPKIDRQAQLRAKPIRLVEPKVKQRDDGGVNLTIPLKRAGVANWLFRVPEGATKTFELDQMGLLVWENIDGKTSVQQLIRKLARRYQISLREAEVSTLAFLNMLTRKSLIGVEIKAGKGEKIAAGPE